MLVCSFSSLRHYVLGPHWKKYLFRLTRPTSFWMADCKLFSHLHRKFFVYTHVSESYRSQYHTSVSERMRAMHCPHASRSLWALNSRILASTRKRTLLLEYWQLTSRVLTIIRVGSNFCGCVSSGECAEWWLEETCTRRRVVMIILQQVLCLPLSFFRNEISGKKTKNKKSTARPLNL